MENFNALHGRAVDAMKNCDRAIELEPNDARAHYNLGVAKAQLKNYGEAIEDFNTAIDLEPMYADPLYNQVHAKYLQDPKTSLAKLEQEYQMITRKLRILTSRNKRISHSNRFLA